jgi:hypothetical protein
VSKADVIIAMNIVLSCSFGVLRLAGFRGEFFQALAHLYIGGLFTASYLLWSRDYVVMGVALVVIECVCAFILYPVTFHF